MFWSRIDPTTEAATLRVGALTIDRREQAARIDGKRLDLSPLLFQLLVCLAERRGSLVTRAELKSILWPYAARIDTERRLNTAVRALRVALADDGDAPRFIGTVRSHGYRWIAVDGRPRIPAAALWVFAILAAGAALTIPNRAGETGAPGMALIEAQAAVDTWRQVPTSDNLAMASASISRAGNGNTPAVHLLRAQLAIEGQWDWAGGERHYRRALALAPDNADALLGLAWLETNRGQAGRALALVEQLTANSTLTEDRRANLGWLLIRLDRPQLAATACHTHPASSINLLSCAHVALAATGRTEEARQRGIDLMRRVGAAPDSIGSVSAARAGDGYARFLEWRARHFLPPGAPWFHQAQVLADAGHRREALDALGRSVAARESLAVKIGSTPSFASLRANRRFRRLAQQVGVKA